MLSVEIKENGQIVGELSAPAKQFKTGSRGYYGMGKIQIPKLTLRKLGLVMTLSKQCIYKCCKAEISQEILQRTL